MPFEILHRTLMALGRGAALARDKFG